MTSHDLTDRQPTDQVNEQSLIPYAMNNSLDSDFDILTGYQDDIKLTTILFMITLTRPIIKLIMEDS